MLHTRLRGRREFDGSDPVRRSRSTPPTRRRVPTACTPRLSGSVQVRHVRVKHVVGLGLGSRADARAVAVLSRVPSRRGGPSQLLALVRARSLSVFNCYFARPNPRRMQHRAPQRLVVLKGGRRYRRRRWRGGEATFARAEAERGSSLWLRHDSPRCRKPAAPPALDRVASGDALERAREAQRQAESDRDAAPPPLHVLRSSPT